MTENNNPDTHRIIQTREGVVSIPREQKGVPLSEYFRNADMPPDLNRAVVYATEKGPVLAKPDPVAWSNEHAEQARHYAGRVKELIDEKGYYSRSLGILARRLSDATGHPEEEMKAVIVEAFERETGKDPFTYLRDQRREQGLPVSERDEQTRRQQPGPERE